MTSIQRVVSIGAHSLDAELMGGPLILKYARQGAHCTLIHVTQGRLEDPGRDEGSEAAVSQRSLDHESESCGKAGRRHDLAWLRFQQYAFAGGLRSADGHRR